MNAWGKHLIVDARKCVPQFIRCPFRITDFSHALVKKIDMVPYGQPWIQHFGSEDKAGYTLVQLIETSNVVAHFAEHNNSAFFDVFSCKDFNQDDVESMIHEYFWPERMHSRILMRGDEQLR
jgi:S-adenosylmethionine/arginine decarboxylase-like enzyme